LCEIEQNDHVTGEEMGMACGAQTCRGGVVADTVGMGKTAQVRTQLQRETRCACWLMGLALLSLLLTGL
jgi:hypothetical protein